MKSILTLSLLFFTLISKSQSLFTTPNSPFINTPTEAITDLSFSNVSISQVQSAINTAKSSNPENVIRITLTGNFSLSNSPLVLSDKMLLFLNNATIEAAVDASATALISISNARYISIVGLANGILDGKNIAGIKGIDISNSGKIHIDQITVKNCVSGGINYIGKGVNVYADAGSVTRTNLQNCGSFGIKFNDSFNFICTDNTINNCVLGISTNSNNALISTNTITACTSSAVEIKGYLDVISYNIINNNAKAISLYNSSTTPTPNPPYKSEALVSYNTISNNGFAFSINADDARVYYNNCNSNASNISGTTGANNQFFCNVGLVASNEGSFGTYFNPPTINNQHNDFIRTGKARYDFVINSADDNSISNIRTAIDNAISANPNKVIVAHLNGSFLTSGTTDTLLVKDNVCILLNGIISNGNSTAPVRSIVYFKDNNIISSFSGGTIDGANATNPTLGVNGFNALIYVTGSANVILDHITVNNSAGEGITKRNSTSPTFINACTVNNSVKRGIWQLASKRLFAFENTVNKAGSNGVAGVGGSTFDGFDLDAYSQTSVLAKNTASNCTRFGVFVEEGAANHIVFGNTLTANNRGISFYNLNVGNKNSSRNLIAYNICRYNVRGIHIESFASDKATIDNILFNNICENNTEYGINGFYNPNNTFNNYCALNSLQNNINGAYNASRDYTVNTVWNVLPNPQTTLAIDFINFNGKNTNKGNLLSWKIGESQLIQLFEIQRANEAKDFLTIASQLINDVNSKDFSFFDRNPYKEVNYYRLKALEAVGTSSFSKVIAVENTFAHLLAINYVFKLDNELKFNITSNNETEELSVILYDLSGKKIASKHLNMNNSPYLDGAISLPFIHSGIYVFAIKTASEFITKKISLTN
jgi:hypothetical protein